MPAKKTTSRTSSKTSKVTRISPLAVTVVCAVFVLIGVFLVYQSFAAAVPK